MIETTETHGTIEGEYRAWYAGADTKARLDDLKTYMRDAYRAKELVNYEHTASDDFSKPYSMSIEMKDAPVGFTDLRDRGGRHQRRQHHRAAAGIFRCARSKTAEARQNATPRTADVVFEPFVTEWHYRIQPPPGFQPRAAAG